MSQVLRKLERLVAERTRQLTAVNEDLAKEIAERKQSEARNAYRANLLTSVPDAVLATDDRLGIEMSRKRFFDLLAGLRMVERSEGLDHLHITLGACGGNTLILWSCGVFSG